MLVTHSFTISRLCHIVFGPVIVCDLFREPEQEGDTHTGTEQKRNDPKERTAGGI
jgi:hypothetical protein